jgi:hypothetical protein
MVWDQDISSDPNTATFLVNHQFVAGQYERSDYDIEIVLTNQNGASYTIVYNTHGCS